VESGVNDDVGHDVAVVWHDVPADISKALLADHQPNTQLINRFMTDRDGIPLQPHSPGNLLR